MAEQGFDTGGNNGWMGIWAPAKLPKAELERFQAALKHCSQGASIWKFASNDDGEPDVVLGCAGDVPTTEAVAAEITGDEIVTGFNPAYLLDGLSALAGEKIDLSFTQANKPVVISSTDGSDSNAFRYLLMPRRLLS